VIALVVQPPPHERFDPVRAVLSDLDAAGLAAAAGAVSLLPANGHRLWRLGALAALAAERHAGGDLVTQRRLRVLLNGGPLAAIAAQQDDPFDDLLTEELAFYGGSYLVGAGLAERSVYVLRLLMHSLLLTDALPDALRGELTRLCVAGLRLSDHVLRGAGLERHQEPLRRSDSGLEVPGQSRLRRLMELCSFTDKELGELAGGAGALDPLVLEAGERRFGDAEVGGGLPDRWPLVRFGEQVVVARPFDVLVAVRHHTLLRAVAEVGAERVADAFAAAVQEDVLASLWHMKIRARVVEHRSAEQSWIEAQAEIDVGLRLVCAIVPDTLLGLTEDPYGMFDTRQALDETHARFEQRAGEYDGRVLGLLVTQPAGRSAFTGLHEPHAPNLTLEHITGADLEVLSFLEQDDRLALWKFADAHSALRSEAKVWSFSTLDTYSIFLDHERSLAPMRSASLVTIHPASGAHLRQRAKRGRDRHGTKYVDGTVREVERTRGGDFGHRLYHVSEVVESRLLRHVGGAPLDLWVRGPEGGEVWRQSRNLVETVAYWLGELVDPLQERLAGLAERTSCIRIDVDVADREFWFEEGTEPDLDPGDHVQADGRTARLVLGSAVRLGAPQPDNAGERVLVAHVIEALEALAEGFGLSPLAERERLAIAEQVAPLGLKKHLIVLPGAGNELLAPAEGPPRTVQEADLTAARELLGVHLMQRFGLPVGPVPDELREAVVKAAVDFLLVQVQALLDGADPEGLLEDLLANNERLIADSELQRALLPARAATHPAADDRQRLRERLASSAQAAVCCRFLAEYVTAQPPVGEQRWSIVFYDRAMALAAVMLEWAHLDDALYYGMSDVGLLINSDHELRLQELDRYQQGRSEHFDLHVDDHRRRAERVFGRHFEISSEAEPSDLQARMDSLMAQEAGASLGELSELLHTAADFVRAADVDVMAMDREAAIGALAADLGWERTKVEQAMTYLSMGSREHFLNPPGGSWQDVVLSRFARRFSLNRRPFLQRGDQLLWGQRQPLVALWIIVGQISSGRFHRLAETEQFRAELSRLADEAGHAFEHEVAEIFDASSRFTVRERLRSVGDVALKRDNNEDLGDIDVLAADTVARTVYGVECKDLHGALTPTEVASELSEHFDAQAGVTTSKHAERISWLEQHRAEMLLELGLDGPPERWQVKGMFVTGERVMAPYIKDVRFPIVAADDLPNWIDGLLKPYARRHRKHKARRS
jgi:hypothetical protein